MTVPMIKSIGDVPYPIDTHSDAFSPLLTAGAALGITGNGPTESAAWLQRVRTSDGPTTIRSIHGRTLRWNQLRAASDGLESQTINGVTFTKDNDGSVTVSGTPTANGNLSLKMIPSGTIPSGHKVLVRNACPAGGSSSTYYAGIGGGVADTGNGGITTFSTTATTYFRFDYRNGVTIPETKLWPQLFDLTVMFGAGSEPNTIEEFEALYGDPYYPYDPGSLLPVNMTGIESTAADESWTQTRNIPAGTLRSAGTVYDEQTASERITRVGERAYQSGDESDPTVTTDGTITYYPLATPTTTPIDPPLNMTYRTAAGGTERVMVPTGELSAPPTLVTAQGYTAESLRDAALSCIAPVENGLASTNYAVGSYLIHGGQLCKVTTAIATGEAITIGTNVTATTVMAEVIALIAQ